MLIFTVHTYSKVNNFLSVCIVVYSWQTRIPVKPKVVVMFFPPTVEQKVCLLYPQCFLRASERGDCQNVLCNRCNLRGGVARGRREAGAGVGRLVQIDTLHTRTACQTDKVPSSALNQMLPSVIHARSWISAAQRQCAARQSGWDVYIATGVPCVSNYRSALPHGETFILTVLSRRRQPCWPCLPILLLIESRSPYYYLV